MNPRREKGPDMSMDLVNRCARGEEDAYRELLQKYEKPLINFIVQYVGERHTAEDVFQETWVRVIRAVKSYKPTASLTTWIFTIARNLCLDQIKYTRRHKTQSLSADRAEEESLNRGTVHYFQDEVAAKIKTPEQQAQNFEISELLRRALSDLAPQKREAILLRISMEFTYEEIAAIVRAPVGTVKYRVHDALKELSRKVAIRKTMLGGQADAV